jgi:hypothetical protein
MWDYATGFENMQRETGIDDRAKNAREGGFEDCGWRVAGGLSI